MDIFTFVTMPFDAQYNDIYTLGIKQPANECGVKVERLDEQLFCEGMLERIYRQIDIADFIIADLSGKNPNVFYELGYAHAKNKTCLLLTKDALDIPFDLKHMRHIVYGDSISYLQEELRKNINWVISGITMKAENKISVEMKPPTGDLTTSEHSADATITFEFDLFNKTNQMSPDITAIYLYTGNLWNIRHDSRECSRSKSDIAQYNYRYFIHPPSPRIGQSGWVPLKLKISGTLAYAYKGDEIKDEYAIKGYTTLRIETSEGNYDYEFRFNLILKDIPF